MDRVKQFQKISFWVISVFMLAMAAALGAVIWFGLEQVAAAAAPDAGNSVFLNQIQQMAVLLKTKFYAWVMPAVAGAMLILGWILCLVLGVVLAPVVKAPVKAESGKPASTPGKKDFLDQKVEQERKHRLFLHTLSVLQREGRLLDFFDEDLKQYSDEQIGAAVRSIQADCKQAVKKYIDPRPVVNANEGETFTVAPGFDMNAITLVGNVTGEPPFEGIVRHPGWKAGKKEIPRLADIRDASVITPAEIEIKAGS
ncbi:DUF2760 domain-containing protein [Desulfotignum phosphitoxidans]|uniref:DUF2760 domain-containing protein n=1 Tax=Desulfotignum phosphitoxidans DSM 13687 TaxID=1286635 RepID=S0G6R0_9BACT|nr:DUF2760 domain-containing protein [Desulfotignum phosphitoxidans]EMS80527.1 hypothetical protein Dpo_2c02160 [Desulfotignum phosphitoxidans DSM 13687]